MNVWIRSMKTYLLLRVPRRVILYVALATVLSQSAGELVVYLRTTETKVGDSTYFNCSTNHTSGEIFWYHGLKYIYTGDAILDPYRGRFEIDRNSSNGSHNLVIRSVQIGDVGEYSCVDDDGFGERRSAELIVLDDDPDCQSNIKEDGVIGQNSFNIPPDEVQLTCTVNYHGKNPPEVELKKVGDDSFIKDSMISNVTSTNRLMYTLKLKGDISLDKSSFVCQTKRSTQNQYNCTSEISKVFYFIGGNTTEQKVVRGETITCIASNNTFPCTRNWHHGNNSCPLSCDETITPHLLGVYLCTLKCNVRGTDYLFNISKAVVLEATTSPPDSVSTKVTIVVVVLLIIFVLAVIIGIVSLVVRHKRSRNAMKIAKACEMENLLANIAVAKEESSNVVEEEIELLYKIKEAKAIQGVAILNKTLFVVRENRPELEAYNCDNFSAERRTIIEVIGLVAAIDICSCRKHNCLYIMNKRKVADMEVTDKKTVTDKKEVMRVSTKGALIKSWYARKNVGGYMSTTAEGNVIITVQEKHMLLEYSPEGKLLRDIVMTECSNPWHAIKKDNDQYVVSHGSLSDTFNKVCLVNTKGIVDNSFGREIGSSESQLKMPFYLAVAKNGCVIVADLFNNRVLLLDSSLKFKAKLVPKYKQRFRNPRRIHLDEDLGFLIVAITAGDPKKTLPAEESNLKEGEEKDGTSTEKRRLIDVDASQLIEEDCRLLVFKMPLSLQTVQG